MNVAKNDNKVYTHNGGDYLYLLVSSRDVGFVWCRCSFNATSYLTRVSPNLNHDKR